MPWVEVQGIGRVLVPDGWEHMPLHELLARVCVLNPDMEFADAQIAVIEVRAFDDESP